MACHSNPPNLITPRATPPELDSSSNDAAPRPLFHASLDLLRSRNAQPENNRQPSPDAPPRHIHAGQPVSLFLPWYPRPSIPNQTCGPSSSAYPLIMSTISVNDLQKQPAQQWLEAADQDGLVVTSEGEPVAVLMRVAPDSLESTRALLRSVRALQAQANLQQAAVSNGTAGLSLPDIDAEITATRRARQK
jgi:PHD/YefM family antitoxin component YafN of YafNO toxin-antitoxin module